MIALTAQLDGCELGLSSRQDDARTAPVAKYNGRDIPNQLEDAGLST